MGITGQRAFLVGPIAVLIGLVASGPIQAAPITGGTGPGGVGLTDGSSDLAVWLKADALVGSIGDGASVGGTGSQWTDASGSGNHGAAANPDRYPTFRSSGSRLLNGNPIVEFDGSNDRLYLGSPTILTLTDLGSDISAFTVTKLDDFDSYRNVVIAGYNGGAGGFTVGIPNDGSPAERYRVAHRNADGSATRVSFERGTTRASLLNPDLISVVSGPSAIEMRLNGSVEVSKTYTNINPTPDDRVAIGGVDISNSNPFDGSFAEVVVFGTNVNAAERIVIQNYLQAKYNDSTADNMTIADDKYAGDTTANGDYDLDVFGIGRVDGSNQLTSTGSAGLGIEVFGTLADGQFVMAGHKIKNNSLTTDDVPTDCWKRWDRTWFVDETNNPGVDLQLAFDFSDAGLDPSGSLFDLLYSPTNAFDFEMLGLPATVVGDRVTFTLPAAMLEDGYYTLGMVPEPSSAALLALGLLGLGLRGRRRRRR